MVDDVQLCRSGEQPTLHEILVAEKLDFEAKVQRAVRRKKWLKGRRFSVSLSPLTIPLYAYYVYRRSFTIAFLSFLLFSIVSDSSQ